MKRQELADHYNSALRQTICDKSSGIKILNAIMEEAIDAVSLWIREGQNIRSIEGAHGFCLSVSTNQKIQYPVKRAAWLISVCANMIDQGGIPSAEHIHPIIDAYRCLDEAESIRHATKGVNVKHDRPNGSREKMEKIREIWATGKYTSRDICAEQECARLDMSFQPHEKP